MKLKAFLKTLDPDTNIYLNTEYGSAFYYIGKPNNNQLEEFANNYYTKTKISLYSKLEKMQKNLKEAERTIPVEDKYKSEKLFKKAFNRHKRHMKVITDKIQEYERNLASYSEFADREVLESRVKTKVLDKNGLIIVTTGYESGKYYLIEEWEKDHK